MSGKLSAKPKLAETQTNYKLVMKRESEPDNNSADNFEINNLYAIL